MVPASLAILTDALHEGENLYCDPKTGLLRAVAMCECSLCQRKGRIRCALCYGTGSTPSSPFSPVAPWHAAPIPMLRVLPPAWLQSLVLGVALFRLLLLPIRTPGPQLATKRADSGHLTNWSVTLREAPGERGEGSSLRSFRLADGTHDPAVSGPGEGNDDDPDQVLHRCQLHYNAPRPPVAACAVHGPLSFMIRASRVRPLARARMFY